MNRRDFIRTAAATTAVAALPAAAPVATYHGAVFGIGPMREARRVFDEQRISQLVVEYYSLSITRQINELVLTGGVQTCSAAERATQIENARGGH